MKLNLEELKEAEPKCFKCKRDAEIKLSYCDLCSRCFQEQVEKRIRKANRDFQMLDRKDKVIAAISGGKDSAVMLYMLKQMQDRIGFELEALLIDEGIAGYRSFCKQKAEELCQKLEVKLTTSSFKDAFDNSLDEALKKRTKESDKTELKACTICGVFRKHLLNKKARELNGTKLATGHNADDIAQTFLMNLMRSEVERLKRFSPTMDEKDDFVPRIKPLLYVPEKEIALYAMLKNLPFELRECPNSKESFRGEVKDFMNSVEAKYLGIKFNILQSYLKLHKIIKEKEETEAKPAFSPLKCEKCGENSSATTCKACQIKDKISTS